MRMLAGNSMGLFDFFKKGGKDGKPDPSKAASSAAKWAEAATSRRAQAYDRQEALQELAGMGTPEAAEVLLKRFTFTTDPSITDQEEKDLAFEGVLKAGTDAIPVIRAFAAKAESLAWPMKVLKELMTEEQVASELVSWLERWDTEYAKFIDPKLQILVALEDYKHDKIREAVEPFTTDVSDDARFAAVAALLAQDDAACVPALVSMLEDEESVRIKTRTLDGLAQRKWVIAEDLREPLRKGMLSGYTIDGDGLVQKR
jgi:HEAT repeat protein